MAAQLSLTKAWEARGPELMNGAGDQFFARAGLIRDEHGRIGRRDGLYLMQHMAEGGAVSHNVRKVQLTADGIFQIQLLLRELVCERRDLTIARRSRRRWLPGWRLARGNRPRLGKGLLWSLASATRQDTMAAQSGRKQPDCNSSTAPTCKSRSGTSPGH